MNRLGSAVIRRLPVWPFPACATAFSFAPTRTQMRWKSRSLRPYLSDLWSRKQFVTEPEPLRSAYPNWNQDAELAAFVARLGESVPWQDVHRLLLSEDAEPFELAAEGKYLAYDFITAYIRFHLPSLPEEGVLTVADWVADRAKNVAPLLGFNDLQIMSTSTDVGLDSLFFAFVQMIAQESNVGRAERFVLDLLITELSGEDVMHLWFVANPIRIMKDYFDKRALPNPEPRLLRSSGGATVTPVYVVGFYSGERLLGQSAGEDILTAEEFAARDVLRHIFGVPGNVQFTFGQGMDSVEMTDRHRKPNWSLSALTDDTSFAVLPPLPEPLQVKDMYLKYMDETQAKFGRPYRRRLKHKFHGGTRFKVVIRNVLKPKLSTL